MIFIRLINHISRIKNIKSLDRVKIMASASVRPDVLGPPTEHPHRIFHHLKDLCRDNEEFFKSDDTDAGERLRAAFSSIRSSVDEVLPLVDHLREVAPSFDFDEKTPGNGYRSFIKVVDSCILHSIKLGKQVNVARDGLIFRKVFYMKELEASSQLLASLGSCLHQLHQLLSWSKPGELFADENYTAEKLLAAIEGINQYCFYGRCIGFQFIPSIRNVLKGIAICMAGFSEAYYSRSHIINSFWAGGKFMMDPELRAKRIVNISQCSDIHFCKAFWFLSESEMMSKLPTFISSPISVNRIIVIPPEPIQFNKADGSPITVEVPDVHIGPQTLNVRLISKLKREGMVGEGAGGHPKSRGLLFHCHGGGFVATSSRSHEVYLREWAIHLDVPILSVDYSLAPRAPFPRAIHEVFYAYCWAIKNAALLGTTAEKIVLVGDSAGANLVMATCIKLIEDGFRLPDGIFMAYAPMVVNFVPSPARLLSLMDPLLPFGFLLRCLKAYALPPKTKQHSITNSQVSLTSESNIEKDYLKPSISQDGQNGIGISDASSYEEVSESDLVELQAHKSLTSDHLSDTLSGASLSSEHRTLVSPTNENEERSQHCVSDFLDKYVLDSDTDSEGQKIPVIKKKSVEPGVESPESNTLTEKSITELKSCSEATSGEVSTETLKSKGIQTRISKAAGNIVGTVSNTFSSFTSNKEKNSQNSDSNDSKKDDFIAKNPLLEFEFTIPRDPYLSPYWASDELLKKLPPINIMTVHLDPCLDDCVMFAKKLKNLGNDVSLDILEGLPHGFLNFSKINKESRDGCLLCVLKLNKLLNMDSLLNQDNNAKDIDDLEK